MASAQPRSSVMTRAEWHQLLEAGVIDEDVRVELLEGRITPLAAKTTHHRRGVMRAFASLYDLLPRDQWLVMQEQPIALSDISEPEPDVVVVPAGDYVDDHPAASQALLIIECAWTSLDADRRKAQLYCRAGSANVWVVDLKGRAVEVFGNDGVERRVELDADPDATLAFGRFTVPIAALLP